MANYLVDSADLTSVADAIRTKGGTSAALEFPDGFVDAIDDIETGGGRGNEAEDNDVSFFDYDGFRLYSFSKSEFLALTEMPALPTTHSELTPYDWNWSFADASAYVGKYGGLEIGAVYKTKDGATHFYLDIYDDSVLTTEVRCKPSVSGGVTIDWGDGSSSTVNSTSYVNTSHTYSSPGKYIVRVLATNGTVSFGGGTNLYVIGGSISNSTKRLLTTITKIEFGNNVLLETHVFNSFPALESVVFPWDLTSIGNYSFQYDDAFACLIFPSGFSSLGSSGNFLLIDKALCMPKSFVGSFTFRFDPGGRLSMPEGCLFCGNTDNRVLAKRVVIPSGTTSVWSNAFRSSHSTRYIEIGEDVTTIGATAFMEAPASEIHLRPTTPPTLSNTNAFSNWLQNSAIFYVPYSADHSVLEAYKTATNWSTWADRMQEETT